MQTVDANEAVASVAYRLSEVIAIYPITPASPMGEHADEWSVAEQVNLWGSIPQVIEMQSEGGAAGAVHGALQAGALTTTFTASQGLLLMLPNLYKIAGELTSFCLHVAARSIATHALSIFGDHSDVMAARQSGFALLASGSPQEAQDLAAIAHAATLVSRVPFLHFFDGFRTSHEIQKLAAIDDATLHSLLDPGAIAAHSDRALSPEHPVVRGTSQNPDAFFQGREAANAFHDACPDVVADTMARFAELTGRSYAPFNYVGHPQAERVVVMMGSGAQCAHETVEHLVAAGEKVGLVKVRLYRPFSMERFTEALPTSVRSIAVLDRTKEPGSTGEPLLLDVIASLVDALGDGRIDALPQIIGGRYGLSSKEFTPAMAKSVFDELEATAPRRRFTVGINDDVTHLSLPVAEGFDIEADDVTRAVFFGLGSDGTVSSNKAAIRIIGAATELHCQGHFVYDSKKAGATTVSHLRFGPRPIRSTYEITRAGFVGVHEPGFLERLDVLEVADEGATVLLNTTVAPDQLWDSLPAEAQRVLSERNCRLYAIDATRVAEANGLGRRINTVMSTCFFALSGVLPRDEAIAAVKQSVSDTWGKRGPEIERRNFQAIDATLAELHEVAVGTPDSARHRPPTVPVDAPDFVANVTRLLLEGHGDRLPVSAFPPDGTWPTGTSKYEKRAIAIDIPIWEPDLCVQCNRCSMICPHAAIRTKVFEPDAAASAPPSFRHVAEEHTQALEGLQYVVQVAPDDCTGCRLCVEVCPAKDRSQPKRKAINMRPAEEHRERERESFAFYQSIPDVTRSLIPERSRTLPLLQPLFEFSGACAGCGETPYLRLLTQLYGDRLVMANATGCSSIYGGNLPTTPYTTNADGRGPAWSNSLFEDNAEFGLGMRLGVDSQEERVRTLLERLASVLPARLLSELRAPCDPDAESIAERRQLVAELTRRLMELPESDVDTDDVAELLRLADHLVPRSVWIVGGDGWAYDIGFGGLDHVLASDRKVNVLVLDTEVYSNTGGQASKATPMGAVAKYASAGKETGKKDLGLLAMTYGHVYVASVAMQARNNQTVKALLEAEAHPGPSLIIAHSPCIAHGYDLAHSPTQQRRAIDSGAWPLYRFDPRRIAKGEPPLKIDADPLSIPMDTYMREEARFRMVELRDPERFKQLVNAAEAGAAERHALYQQLAQIRFPAADGPAQEDTDG
ncbi:MAG: pyruvate:ferredoxin (flavodoxin) oxidoreductase [Candidatus Microthrix sp.]|nr:pyruvate:ferredoxin (flavodoxin) oxidoreductase [Candidatus Microthrix sp.]